MARTTDPILPALMYGTAWKQEATTALVVAAVEAGFRAIDTANQPRHYSEALVGAALRELAAAGIGRDQLFVQTKFTSPPGQDHRIPYDPAAAPAEQVAQSLAASLEHLGTDRLDAYVLHGPSNRSGLAPYDLAVWRAMEDAHRAGTVDRLGVSNVTAAQLEQLAGQAGIAPALVQNRCYADRGWDREVRALCRAHGMVYQGFSLLTANPQVLVSAPVLTAARRLQRTPAQVVLRFALDVGMLPLTGTTDPEHMRQDLEITSFALLPDEIAAIEAGTA